MLNHLIVYVPWDIEEYYAKRVKAGRDNKHFEFSKPGFGAFSQPLTVVDSKGRIILWYLPGLMPNHQQVGIYLWQACAKSSNMLK